MALMRMKIINILRKKLQVKGRELEWIQCYKHGYLALVLLGYYGWQFGELPKSYQE